MPKIKYVTAGESHGKMLVGIIENIPAGLDIDVGFVNRELARRMLGYGRGGRMKIERDTAEFVTGVRARVTLGSPVTALIYNNDYENWKDIVGCDAMKTESRKLTAVRPGHADLSGVLKYGFDDARNVLERASARETAMKVALGAVAKLYLKKLGIEIASRTVGIGGTFDDSNSFDLSCKEINARADVDPVRVLDAAVGKEMIEEIDGAKAAGDTLGGVAEISVDGCKPGIGSYVSAELKLDGILMRELGAIQSVKCVEIGDGISAAVQSGATAHDPIFIHGGKIKRITNHAGGIEGGMTNGERIVLRVCFKPIPTLMKGLDTVDIATGKAAKAAAERSDVCVVPAGGVVAEAAVALALASAVSDMLGGDTMQETVERYNAKAGL